MSKIKWAYLTERDFWNRGVYFVSTLFIHTTYADEVISFYVRLNGKKRSFLIFASPLLFTPSSNRSNQKYSRLRCLLLVKGFVICFYLGWSGSILQIRTNIIKVQLQLDNYEPNKNLVIVS